MDLNSTEDLLYKLLQIVDYPLYEDSLRIELSATLSRSSIQYAAAVRVLCVHDLLLGACTTLRSQFESVVRSIWALHHATEGQIGKLSAELSHETQQACKNIPSVNAMMIELEKIPNLANLLIPLKEFKESSWLPLNSFVHSGIHAVHWTKNLSPVELVEQVFRISNGLALLAFQNLGILTGRPGIQSEISSTAASYSSCLPLGRE